MTSRCVNNISNTLAGKLRGLLISGLIEYLKVFSYFEEYEELG
jgi:hypothetical protein